MFLFPASCIRKQQTMLLLIGVLIVFALLMLMPDQALASEGTGGGLPYESWLTKLKQSLTGPFAYVVMIVALVVAGATMVFGGELNGFVKTFIFIVCVAALIIGSSSIMQNLFGQGAELAHLIPQAHLFLAKNSFVLRVV